MKILTDNLYKILKNNSAFADSSPQQIQQLIDDVLEEPIHFKSGEVIFREGDLPSAIYIIYQGNVEVLKKNKESGRYHQLRVLTTGDSLGEMALIDTAPRSAEIRALDNVTLLVLPMNQLEKISSNNLDVTTQLKLKLCKTVADRLRFSSEEIVKSLEAHLEEAKARASLGYFTTYMLIITGIFILLLGVMSKIVSETAITTIVGLPILFLYTLALIRIILKSGYQLSAYGLTTQNWRIALKESLWATLVVVLITVLLKWYLVTMTEIMANEPLFDFGTSLNLSLPMLIMACVIYGLLAPVQEFATRGGLQGALQRFLIGSPTYRTWMAIFIANLMFSALHVFFSIKTAALVFPVGLLWGWLYSRHGTIIGISISHIIVGLFGFYVVGFETILT